MKITKDRKVFTAVSAIKRRSEKQNDEKIIDTYVDSMDIVPQLTNNNSQIVYGRRGTGKTHLFKYLEKELKKEDNRIIVYIDARTLGSATQFNDNEIKINSRCTALFRDVLAELYNSILEYLPNKPDGVSDVAFELLCKLCETSTEPGAVRRDKEVVERTKEGSLKKGSAEIGISDKGVGAKISNENIVNGEKEKIVTSDIIKEDKVIFPEIKVLLEKIMHLLESEIFILFDEWSSLPMDIQPYLAEFFKKAYLPNSKITLKIAALEFRSCFGIMDEYNHSLGFELGSDIAVALDLDEHFVFDKNPVQVSSFYADLLYSHIESELPDNYFRDEWNIKKKSDFINKFFSKKDTFEELARASEGVPRDLINIFSISFSQAKSKNLTNIRKGTVVEASRQWFEQDKSKNLDEKLHVVLSDIIDVVIGGKQARSFMLKRGFEKHAIIQRLFDARVLHVMRKGYADKDNPGVRYNVYTLDYGTYVDLIKTNKEPQRKVEVIVDSKDDSNFIVPFDDARSIRSIILEQTLLDKWST